MAQPICGYVLDVLGLKIGFAIFAIAWSLINMAHGLADSWQAFAWLRGLLGFSEGSANPAGMKATAEWFPAKERGIAGGVFNIGASVGSMLAPPLVAWAILIYNWRAAFVITGSLGLVWVVLWLLFYQSPDKHPALSDRGEDAISPSGQEKHLQGDGSRPSLLKILAQRNFWGIALPRFLADPTWGTLSFWLPLYLSTVRHMDLKHIALFAWMPFLAADFGCLFGGLVAMRRCRNDVGLSVINARRCAFTLGACLMMGVGFVGFVQSPYAAIALLSLAGFAHQTLSVTVITMASDLFKQKRGCHGRRDGGHVRQCGAADLLAADRRPGRDDRLYAVLRLPRPARPGGRGCPVDAGSRTQCHRRNLKCRIHRPAFAIRSCPDLIRTLPSSAWATTITSPPRRSSGIRESRSIIPATWSIGVC